MRTFFSLLLALPLLAACGRTPPLTPGHEPVVPSCALLVEPRSLDFGVLAPGAKADRSVTLRNEGDGPCALDAVTWGDQDDETFEVSSLPTLPATLAPSTTLKVPVTFSAGTAKLPLARKATLTLVTSSKVGALDVVDRTPVALSARLAYCHLVLSPDPVLDLGNIQLNTSAIGHITLVNEGSVACDVTNLVLGAGTDRTFSLLSQARTFSVAPGGNATIGVGFSANDSAPPHLREGSVEFDANDALAPHRQVGLSAYINTTCTEAGQYIYTVDNDGRFSRFDPRTLSYRDIATLNCPSTSTPFSMNVDQSGVAWVIFGDMHLYRVDTATAACTATSYQPNQAGFGTYGMGSTWDSRTATDTLYIAGANAFGSSSPLGKIAFPGLTVSAVGTIPLGSVELAGTGDGQLWGFSPSGQSGTGSAMLGRINPATGALLEKYTLPTITSVGGWAIKFFGGSFYVFVGSDVWKVDRASLDPTRPQPTSPPQKVLVSPGRDIVGAGVSTCAPVQ